MFRRYRRALVRAALAVIIGSLLYALIFMVGVNSFALSALWINTVNGLIFSGGTAIAAFLMSWIVWRIVDPTFQRSETFRTAMAGLSSAGGAFLAWMIVGGVETYWYGSGDWFFLWGIIAIITAVCAGVSGFILIALDERRHRLTAVERANV